CRWARAGGGLVVARCGGGDQSGSQYDEAIAGSFDSRSITRATCHRRPLWIEPPMNSRARNPAAAAAMAGVWVGAPDSCDLMVSELARIPRAPPLNSIARSADPVVLPARL